MQKIVENRARAAFGVRLDFRYAFGNDLNAMLAELGGFGKNCGGILEGFRVDIENNLKDFR